MLTGGGSTRLGTDKAAADVAGVRMIDRVLGQIPVDVPVVVVGPPPEVERPVTVLREDPPGAGPAAAIMAGLPAVRTPVVAVMAVDMPFCPGLVRVLVEEPMSADALVPRTGDHPQGLCAVYRTASLRQVRVAPGDSVRALLGQLTVTYVECSEDVMVDIDTPELLHIVEQRLSIMDQER